MKFRHVNALAAALAAGVLLAGCTAAQSSTTSQSPGKVDQPNQLTVMIGSSPSGNALQAIAPAYTKKTGVKIDFVQVPNDQLSTKIVLAGQSKSDSFDVAQFDAPTLASIVPAGGLADISSFVTSDKSYDWKDFAPALQKYGQLDGKTYGVSLSTEPYVAFYRTDIYEKAGLKPATTWAGINSNAKAIAALNDGTYGYDGPYGPQASAERFFQRLLGNGGRVLDPKTNEPLLNTSLAKKVLKDFVALAPYSPPSTISGAAADGSIAFQQQGVATNVEPSGWYSQLNNPLSSKATGKVGVAATPLEKNGTYPPQNLLKGWLIGVNANSQHEAAAWQFLSFALGKSNVQNFINAAAPVPGRTSTLNDPKYIAQLPYLKYLPPTIEHGTTLPIVPEMPQILTLTSQAISSIVSQHADVNSTLDSLNDQVKQLLQQGGTLKQ